MARAGDGADGGDGHAARAMRAVLLASVATAALLGPAHAQAPTPAQPLPPQPPTMPTGGRVVAGSATIAAPDAATRVITQTTQRTAIDWNSFSVGQGGHVQFQQPNAAAIALNRVTGPDASVIAGRISANGQVAIVNQSGIVFTPTARVDVGALVASAANISNENFMAGRMVFDQAPRPGAQVTNEGRITVAQGGLAALVAPQAANRGTIEAKLGRVVIGGAETYALDLHGDGLLSLEVRRPTTATGGPAASNSGTIAAEGGTVLITAEAAGQLVQSLVEAGGTITAREGGRVAVAARGGEARVSGTVDVTSATARGGAVTVTGRQVTVGQGARIDASGGSGGGQVLVGGGVQGTGPTPRAERASVAQGASIRADATAAGNGGTVVVWADDTAFIHGTLTARGGPQGGNGGFVETSGVRTVSLIGARIDTSAPRGAMGQWLLDPISIDITNETSGATFENGVLVPGQDVAGVQLSAADLAQALGLNNVTLTTAVDGSGSGRITVLQPVSWSAATTLTLLATNDIAVNAAITAPAGGLVLTTGTGASVSQSTAGTISVASLQVTGPDGITLNNAGNAIPLVTTLSSTGSISLASSVPLTIEPSVTTAGDLTLAAPALTAAALTAGAGRTASLTADSLTLTGNVRATGGRVALAPFTAGRAMAVGNVVGAGGAFLVDAALLARVSTGTGTLQVGNGAATGAITLASGLTIASPRATTLDLRSGGAVTQQGPLTVARLAASGSSVTLNDSQNAVGTLLASTTTAGAFNLVTKAPAPDGLAVDGAVTAAGTLSLGNTAGGIALRAPVGATGGVTLAAEGSITQTAAGTITAPSVTVSVTGTGSAIALATAANTVPVLAGATIAAGGGSFAFRTIGALDVGGPVVVPGSASFQAGAGLSQSAGITASSVTASAGSDGLTLNRTDNSFATLAGATASGGPVVVSSAAGLSVTGAVTGSTVTLASSGGTLTTTVDAPVTATGGVASISGANGVSLGALVSGFDGVTLASSGGSIAAASVSALGGPVSITAANNVTLSGTASGASGVTITATAGQVAAAGATSSGGAVTVTGQAGVALSGNVSAETNATVTATAGSVTAQGVTASSGTLTVTGDMDVALAGPASGFDGVSITATTGTITTAGVSSSGGPVTITGDGVTTGTVTAAVGDVTVTGTSLTLAGISAADGDVTLSGATISATGTIAADGDVAITATTLASLADVTAVNDVTISAPDLSASGTIGASRDVAITATTLASLAGVTAGRDATISAPDLSASGTIGASRNVAITATTLASLAGVTAGNDVTISAPDLSASGTIGASRDVAITATTLASLAGVTAGRDATITTPSLSASGTLAAGTGRTLAITTDALNVAGALRATNGLVSIVPRTPGSAIALGGGGGGLVLGQVQLARVDAGTGTLRIGNATSGPITVTGATNVIGRAGLLDLVSGGAITQGSSLSASRLRATAGGAIALGNTTNSLAVIDGATAATGPVSLATSGPLSIQAGVQGSAVTLASGTTMAIQAPVTAAGGTLSLTAGSAVTQTGAGTLTAARLTGSAGNLALADAANSIGTLGQFSATSGLALGTTGPLALDGAISTLGALSLASGGAITAGAGTTLTAAVLTGSAIGGSDLGTTAHPIAALGPWTDGTGGFAMRSAGPLSITGDVTLAGPLSLTVGGTLAQAGGTTIATAALTGSAIGSTTLVSGTNAIRGLGEWNDGAGGLALATTTALALDGAVTLAARLDLASSVSITQGAAGSITAPRVTATAPGGVSLFSATNTIDAFGPVSASAGDVRLATAAPLVLDGAVAANGTLTLSSGGTITQNDAISAARLEASAAGGITLEQANNAIASLGAVSDAAGGRIGLRSTGPLVVDGRVETAGALVLAVDGAISQTATGGLAAATLAGTSNGGAVFGSSGNTIATLAGWTNTGGGGFTLVNAADLAIAGAVDGGSGAVTVTTQGGGAIAVGADITTSNAPGILLFADGALSVGDQTLSAPLIDLRAGSGGPALSVTGGTYLARDHVVFAASGPVEFTGTTRVNPLSPGNRPTVVVSSRASGELTDASRVRGDVGGLPDAAQFTQIERFTAPLGQTANPIGLGNLVAPSSALFIIVDRGTATGTINVARLGLVILRGATDLSGCVNGVCGPNAASLGRTTDASATARLNNCPVSSPNCLNFPTTISFVSTQPRDFPVLTADRVGDDIDLPLSDVADEDP
ncbi:filamentous hemagglutinin N-terminal domain-containing protein [Elioraea sp.]|uniref:two-partner secretion domain-containing protein n=1 Tax=Elioraea sp. TaxID=2185103 RepID=UPI0025BC5083|nr:filamentous hemagglutinin N-terminal domain-containing protein [Elioraea sp.]